MAYLVLDEATCTQNGKGVVRASRGQWGGIAPIAIERGRSENVPSESWEISSPKCQPISLDMTQFHKEAAFFLWLGGSNGGIINSGQVRTDMEGRYKLSVAFQTFACFQNGDFKMTLWGGVGVDKRRRERLYS